jgi:hypothetical protein
VQVYLLHENDAWTEPLRAALREERVPFTEWSLAGGALDPGSEPPEGVFFSRLSASAHTRGNPYAAAWGLELLDWLALHGRRVVNGGRALRLEISKAAQLGALRRHGILAPPSRVVCGRQRLVADAEAFAQWPLILKPNRGGKGEGVRLFARIQAFADYVGGPEYAEPADGLWLLQQHVRSADGCITRVEFVGGELLYALRVDASRGFELCPAEACQIGDDLCPAGESPRPLFEIRSGFESPLLESYRDLLRAEEIDIAGVEFIEDSAGRLVTYDINTNTNYNPEAERRAGLSGARAVARFLGRELRRLSGGR